MVPTSASSLLVLGIAHAWLLFVFSGTCPSIGVMVVFCCDR